MLASSKSKGAPRPTLHLAALNRLPIPRLDMYGGIVEQRSAPVIGKIMEMQDAVDIDLWKTNVKFLGPTPSASSCRLAFCSLFLGWQFIALYRRLANTGPLQDFQRLRNIRTRSSRGGVVRRP